MSDLSNLLAERTELFSFCFFFPSFFFFALPFFPSIHFVCQNRAKAKVRERERENISSRVFPLLFHSYIFCLQREETTKKA
jgi:hypothetical protein